MRPGERTLAPFGKGAPALRPGRPSTFTQPSYPSRSMARMSASIRDRLIALAAMAMMRP